jgi:phage gp29-like protein
MLSTCHTGAPALSGAAPYAVIPDSTHVETVTNTGNGFSGHSYDQFRKSCNEEILITVLGQTLTTVQGDRGARSLGDVHKQVEEGINMSDMRFVQRILNSRVRPFMESRGLPVAGGKFVFPKAAGPLSVADMVQLSSIMPVPTSFLHEKYGIPVPKDGEPVAGARSPEPDPDPGPDPEPDPEPKSPQGPSPVVFGRFSILFSIIILPYLCHQKGHVHIYRAQN